MNILNFFFWYKVWDLDQSLLHLLRCSMRSRWGLCSVSHWTRPASPLQKRNRALTPHWRQLRWKFSQPFPLLTSSQQMCDTDFHCLVDAEWMWKLSSLLDPTGTTWGEGNRVSAGSTSHHLIYLIAGGVGSWESAPRCVPQTQGKGYEA